MNLIEKMYKAYEVERKINCGNCKYYNGKICIQYTTVCNWEYPPFTAEKQIELITLIGLNKGFEIIPNEGFDYMLSETTFAKYEYNKHGYSMTNFAEALADLTINLKDKIDNSKVKEILEK